MDIFEVGGASAQIAFAVNDSVYENVTTVIMNNKTYSVYSISALGLGMNAANRAMNSLSNKSSCYPNNFNFIECTKKYNLAIANFPII